MDEKLKKTALRMIPYGLYVLTARDDDGRTAAGTINWLTQASFNPPLVAVGVKADSFIHEVIETSQHFAINVLGKDQSILAFNFFRTAELDGMSIGGEPFQLKTSGAPVLESTPAYLECKIVDKVAGGDHTLFIAEVIDAGSNAPIEGRPDMATLWMSDLGEKIFYGG